MGVGTHGVEGAAQFLLPAAGGLALKHDKPGLLSAANSGPDSNTGYFSIVVSPAPHLDGSYTIFGEVRVHVIIVEKS